MTQSINSNRFVVGSRVAGRIAKAFNTSPKPIQVTMKGRKDVARIFKQVQEAYERAHDKPRLIK